MLRKVNILEDMRKKPFFQIFLKKYFPGKMLNYGDIRKNQYLGKDDFLMWSQTKSFEMLIFWQC